MSKTPSKLRAEYGSVRRAVRAAIEQHAVGASFTIGDIAAAIADEVPKSRIGITLAELVRRGELVRVAPGTFSRPTEAGAIEPDGDERRRGAITTFRVVGTLESALLLRSSTDETVWLARRLLPSDL